MLINEKLTFDLFYKIDVSLLTHKLQRKNKKIKKSM